ncbi:MAG: DUF262 domain-containing protein [Eubacteriales bacterium]|jgi:hypothetical protein
MFTFKSNNRDVKSIHTMFKEGTLIIDSTYQRRSVWSERDKIRLVETVLLNLVIPELFFWKAFTDPDSGKSITHIVDGQQRVNAVIDYIDGNFRLKEAHLLEKEAKEKWANKVFSQLSPDEKTSIWNYQFMIIEIDPKATRDDIVKMFRRLNLTDYNLNDQERRNSMHGEFAVLAREISNNSLWETHRLFNATDIKRMKDVEFCATIILLCRNGIIDQTDQKALNQAYEDLQEGYASAEQDKETINSAIDIVESFINDETRKFLQRKAQLYTLFSIAFYSLRERIPTEAVHKLQFLAFVSLYEKFSNEFELPDGSTDDEKYLFDLIKKYKLASSEGLNKHTNRMIRFTVLKSFLYELTPSQIEAQDTFREKLIAANIKPEDPEDDE